MIFHSFRLGRAACQRCYI